MLYKRLLKGYIMPFLVPNPHLQYEATYPNGR